MRARRLALAGLALVVALGAAALWQREALTRLHAVLTLFEPERIVSNFGRMGDIFESRPIPVSGPPEPFPEGEPLAPPPGWEAWLERRAVTGIIVLRDGAVALEEYRMGTGREDARISWSLAKSYLSALIGVLLERGEIESLDDPVTRYAPALAGGAYDGATIRNVLQMSSGVVFDEDYLDFWSDINRMGRVLALGGSMDEFAAALEERDAEPGAAWRYVSIDTHVLGMVARGATGRSVPDLMAEHLLGQTGAYGAPHYITDGYGVAFVLGGLNLTLRDYAGLGELFRNHGRIGERRILPEAWVVESTTPSANSAPGAERYGYQWWMPADAAPREYMAQGVYGQYIYVNEPAGLVVAVTGADLNFRAPGAFEDSVAMFRALAARGGGA